jgi:hypothetical protein
MSPPRSASSSSRRSRSHLAGQLLAMPSLLDDAQPVPGVEPPPLPGRPGFDPWMLTDPVEAARLTLQPYCHAQLRALWTADPDPARTLALHAEVQRAVARGDAQRMPPRTTELASVSRDCPWPPIYVALRAFAIGGHNVEALQPFALVVREEATGFRRALVVGPRIYVPERRRDYGPQPNWSDDVLGVLNPLNLFDL